VLFVFLHSCLRVLYLTCSYRVDVCGGKTLLKVVENIVILTFLFSIRYRGQLIKSKTLSRSKRSHPRTSSTRYRGQLFECKVILELFCVIPVGPCLIISLCSTLYRCHQKQSLNKLTADIDNLLV